jgi:hypothetical protein
LQKNRTSFLLLEALVSMVIVSVFIVTFININRQKSDIPSYASNLLYGEIIKTKCEAKRSSKIILGMNIEQDYRLEYDKNLHSNIIVQYWNISSNTNTIALKRRCYI